MAKRWQERYEFYSRAFGQLKSAVAKKEYSELERAGLIKIFEYTFELGWKLMRDYSQEVGYTVNSPRESIQNAVVTGLIDTRLMGTSGSTRLNSVIYFPTLTMNCEA